MLGVAIELALQLSELLALEPELAVAAATLVPLPSLLVFDLDLILLVCHVDIVCSVQRQRNQ